MLFLFLLVLISQIQPACSGLVMLQTKIYSRSQDSISLPSDYKIKYVLKDSMNVMLIILIVKASKILLIQFRVRRLDTSSTTLGTKGNGLISVTSKKAKDQQRIGRQRRQSIQAKVKTRTPCKTKQNWHLFTCPGKESEIKAIFSTYSSTQIPTHFITQQTPSCTSVR